MECSAVGGSLDLDHEGRAGLGKMEGHARGQEQGFWYASAQGEDRKPGAGGRRQRKTEGGRCLTSALIPGILYYVCGHLKNMSDFSRSWKAFYHEWWSQIVSTSRRPISMSCPEFFAADQRLAFPVICRAAYQHISPNLHLSHDVVSEVYIR